MSAYYNEHDPHAAEWLRNLIATGAIAPGVVDERDIRDVIPDELAGFAQCHFFAGIGVWSYALRRTGWPDSRPVWTGSCPCQPFSAAGKGNGFADERHLWPAWHWLIEQRRPDTIFGEQVASKDGLNWFDLVLADLEGSGYAVGVQDTCAAGVGAPHIRQRLYFVAYANAMHTACGRDERSEESAREWDGNGFDGCRSALSLVNAESLGLLGRQNDADSGRRQRASRQRREACELGNANLSRLEGRGLSERGRSDECASRPAGSSLRPGPVNGFWRNADWLGCTDGKWRPVEAWSFPLASRASFAVGSGGAYEGKSRAKMLKGYGNAINAETAAGFIDDAGFALSALQGRAAA